MGEHFNRLLESMTGNNVPKNTADLSPGNGKRRQEIPDDHTYIIKGEIGQRITNDQAGEKTAHDRGSGETADGNNTDGVKGHHRHCPNQGTDKTSPGNRFRIPFNPNKSEEIIFFQSCQIHLSINTNTYIANYLPKSTWA